MCFQTNSVLLCKVLKSTLQSAVQTGSVENTGAVFKLIRLQTSSEQTGERREKNVEASVFVCVCVRLFVCVHSAVTVAL